MNKTIKIDNKEYNIPKFTFSDICELEELGFDFSKTESKMFSSLVPLLALTMEKSVEDVKTIINEKPAIFSAVSEPLFKALGESDFFRKMAEQKTVEA